MVCFLIGVSIVRHDSDGNCRDVEEIKGTIERRESEYQEVLVKGWW